VIESGRLQRIATMAIIQIMMDVLLPVTSKFAVTEFSTLDLGTSAMTTIRMTMTAALQYVKLNSVVTLLHKATKSVTWVI